EGIGWLDAELFEGLVVRPILDHHGDVGDPVLELARQSAQGPLDEGLELRVRHNPRTRSTFMTSLTSRMACMMPWSWGRSSTSMTKWLMPLRSSVTVISALVMFPCRDEMAVVISARGPGRSLPMYTAILTGRLAGSPPSHSTARRRS